MMKRRSGLALLAGALLAVISLQFATPAQADDPRGARMRDGRGFVLDGRYNHGQYYPAVGAQFRTLPDGYHPYYWGGNPYYFHGGVWYSPGGPGFVVVRPPIGLAVSVLPPFCSTLWFGGIPYYYADNVYYTAGPGGYGYVVVSPPANADQPGEPPSPLPPGQSDLILYPKNGQTQEKQAADDFECHAWAKGQSGYDPSHSTGGDPGDARSNYYRAKTACLQGRGYEVK
jgi:hypothetical protein